MADKITLEDYNTWQHLYNNVHNYVQIPCPVSVGDETELYKIDSVEGGHITIIPKFENYKTSNNSAVSVVTHSDGRVITHSILEPQGRLVTLVEQNKEGTVINIPLNIENVNLNTEIPLLHPKYWNYYLFDEDNGANRKYYISSYYNSIKINNHDEMMVDSTGKYCNLSTIIEDKMLADNDLRGYILEDYFLGLYEPPLITIKEPLYIGCNNNLSDKFNSPIDFEVYINNKKYNSYNLPVGYERDDLLVNVKSKSEYPYLPLNKKFQVPVEYKFAENKSDLIKYEYIKLKNDLLVFDLTFNGFDNVIDLNNYILLNGVVTNNKKTTFKAGKMESCIIVNNTDLTFTDINFKGGANKIVNNGVLTIDECLVNHLNIINNGELNIINSELDLTATRQDLPFIHNIGEYIIKNNNVNVTGAFQDNNIIFIRGLNDANTLLNNNNTWNYDAEYTEEETTYNITGNGFVYSNINEDTIILRNLEVSNV